MLRQWRLTVPPGHLHTSQHSLIRISPCPNNIKPALKVRLIGSASTPTAPATFEQLSFQPSRNNTILEFPPNSKVSWWTIITPRHVLDGYLADSYELAIDIYCLSCRMMHGLPDRLSGCPAAFPPDLDWVFVCRRRLRGRILSSAVQCLTDRVVFRPRELEH